MIYDKATETRPIAEQFELDRESYRRQIAYLFENSTFYRRKLVEAGFDSADAVGTLDDAAECAPPGAGFRGGHSRARWPK